MLIWDLIWEWPQVLYKLKNIKMCHIYSLKLLSVVSIGLADDDYDSGAINVTFGVGDTNAEVSINVNDDSIDEGSEAFGLVLKRTDDTPDFVEIVDPMNATGIIDDDDEPGILFVVVLIYIY